MFQVGELRKHQLLQAHVRCYCIRHHRALPLDADGGFIPNAPLETVPFQTHYMRLQVNGEDSFALISACFDLLLLL